MAENGSIEIKKQESKWYYTPTDEYYSMCISLGEHFGISPKELYTEWNLPMLITTYVTVHNKKVSNAAIEQDYMVHNKKVVITAEKEYIYNVTAEMIEAEENGINQDSEENEAIKMLKKMYNGEF